MATECTRVFLGHQLTPQVDRLVEAVESAFPQKQLRIREYNWAEYELGERVDPASQALARPDVTSWIAIWIKETLPDNEFNSTLAEELIHHLQAAQGFTNLRALSQVGQTLVRDCHFALTSKLLDIHAHAQMQERQIDTDVLTRCDARMAVELVSNMSEDPTELDKLRGAEAGPLLVNGRRATRVVCVVNFPIYLQYWSRIRLSSDPEIRNAWRILESFFDRYSWRLVDFWNDILDGVRPHLIVDLDSNIVAQLIILSELGLSLHVVPDTFPTSGKDLRL